MRDPIMMVYFRVETLLSAASSSSIEPRSSAVASVVLLEELLVSLVERTPHTGSELLMSFFQHFADLRKITVSLILGRRQFLGRVVNARQNISRQGGFLAASSTVPFSAWIMSFSCCRTVPVIAHDGFHGASRDRYGVRQQQEFGCYSRGFMQNTGNALPGFAEVVGCDDQVFSTLVHSAQGGSGDLTHLGDGCLYRANRPQPLRVGDFQPNR